MTEMPPGSRMPRVAPIRGGRIAWAVLLASLAWIPAARADEGDTRVEVELIKVVDGDTLQVRLDGKKEHVRVIGIDSPEKWSSKKLDRDLERTGKDRAAMIALGRRASRHMEELVQGRKLTLVFPAHHERRDRYGRLLAYVDGDGEDLGGRMLRDGFAYPYRRFPHPRLDSYDELFREAVEGKAGLWADEDAEALRDKKEPKSGSKRKRRKSGRR
ncbi:MAG: thermonuclease family protein [Myxococcales bacterium]|nr:thermonuclease family protein [Myxococcales bacterium]